MRLKGKVVLVTGSTTGIGEAIARRCLAEGAKVMFHGLEEEWAKQLVAEFKENSNYIIADLSITENCEKIVIQTVEHFGRIDCLVNNAATMERDSIDTLTSAQFDRIIAINLKAPLFVSQAAIKQFRLQKNPGVILNIGSTNAYCGEPVLTLYSTAKGGLMTMTRNLAASLAAEKIRINQINIGWTISPNEIQLKIKEGLPVDWYKHVPVEYAPSGQLFTPEKIAKHALFWLSDDSAPANGTVAEVEQFPIIGRNITKNQQWFFSGSEKKAAEKTQSSKEETSLIPQL